MMKQVYDGDPDDSDGMVMAEVMVMELMVGRHLYNCHTVNGHLLPRRTDLRIRANCSR